MTPEEAIERLKYIIVLNATEKDYEAIFKGIEALEKDIPKHMTVIYDGYMDGKPMMDMWTCPTCDAIYDIDEKYRRCPICGQKLDWSGVIK